MAKTCRSASSQCYVDLESCSGEASATGDPAHLAALDGEFAKIYPDSGRASIPAERLLRSLLLQAFYTIRSETQLILM